MHAIEVQMLPNTVDRVYVSEMHWVESSAVKADSHEPSPVGPLLAKLLTMTNLTVTKNHVLLRGQTL